MNPQSQENPLAFDLPSPAQAEKAPSPEVTQSNLSVTEAQAAVALERGSAVAADPTAGGAIAPQASAPTAPPPVPAAPQAQPVAQTGWMPQVADDTDLIEKAWVDKAKEIVAQTSHDPYLQNKEMTKVRADYMKKRYNKDIKLSED